MRTSKFFLTTLRETPAEAELISHQLMLRAGMIRKLASGIYTWLPLGLRILKKVETIIRNEMNRIGALELLMPALQPAELWLLSKRWDTFGDQLLKLKDRNQHEFCFGPTHEEVIANLVHYEVRSYKQLPLLFYQIQTKFRDEIRPRFGVMRGREFLMKDGYSFHLDEASLKETYALMYEAYTNIFTKLGLKFRAVLADSGNMGGKISHEFQVLANSGEDLIAYSDSSSYAANVETATTLLTTKTPLPSTNPMREVATPGQTTIAAVAKFLQLPSHKIIKTLIVKGNDHPWVALLLRGDHELNEIKVEKLPQVATPLTFMNPNEFVDLFESAAGSIGPVGLTIPLIADYATLALEDFVCGANKNEHHLINVNWGRDLPFPEVADLRKVVPGDPSPDGQGKLLLARGIEVGQIFQLGKKYCQALQATVLNPQGKATIMQMGCYGIGVSRVVAAAIEQNHDNAGIIWPEPLAPFQIVLIPLSFHKSYRVRAAAAELYHSLGNSGFEVLLDDRKERPGVLFADSDLIGIPHRLVISESGLDQGVVEYKNRTATTAVTVPLATIIEFLTNHIKQ